MDDPKAKAWQALADMATLLDRDVRVTYLDADVEFGIAPDPFQDFGGGWQRFVYDGMTEMVLRVRVYDRERDGTQAKGV